MRKTTIRTRKRGAKWYYSFEAGIINGKRKQVTKGGFDTEKEAKQAGQKAYEDWKKGNVGIVSQKISLQDYLADWLENVIRPEVKRGTYTSYKSVMATRIIPQLGSKIVQELRPLDIDRWVKSLAGRGLAKNSITTAKSILSAALNYAIYPAELISVNPTQAIKVPKSARRKAIKRTIIMPEKLQELLAVFKPGHRYRIPVLLAYHTGMRAGEILGLEWQDVDLERKSICVRQQIQKDDLSCTYYFETPKTDSGNRDFYIDSRLVAELKRWKAAQAAARMEMGEAYQQVYENQEHIIFSLPCSEPCPDGATPKNLVCTDALGLFIKYIAFSAALRKHGVNSHSFRHTHTTELAAAGAVPIDIAARLGHCDASMVNAVYAHDTEAMKHATAEIFERRIVHGE